MAGEETADAWIDTLVDGFLRGEAIDVERFLAEHRELGDPFAAKVRKLAEVLGGPGRSAGDPARAVGNDPPLPEHLGDYRLIRKLGQGGMGTVYLAEQRSLSRLVALKILRQELAASPRARERFGREAHAIARLRHPNIVSVHDAGEENGIAFLAMELLAGRGLDELIPGADAAGPRISVAEAVRAAQDVARALQCAHTAGIVHRDVKPSNIRIVPDGRAVLLDFGLAQGDDWRSLTETGQFRGTPHYAAPEQIEASLGPVDERSDIYSLGATLYECVTGRAPFPGRSTRELFHQILSRDATAPRRLQPEISRDLETVILKAMARERAHRYASAAEFADDLDALLQMRPVRARPLNPVAKLLRFARRRPAVTSTVALALLILFGLPTVYAVVERRGRIRDVRRLEEILRLSDMVLVRELEQRAAKLWPRRQENVAAMEQWLVEARDMLLRVETHRSRLDLLRSMGTAEDMSREIRWQLETLTELVARLDQLPSSVADVEARLAVALAVDRETVEERRAEWQEAAYDIAVREAYCGLEIYPQPGLVPLGPDPRSGLWEFLVLESGDPPERDSGDGNFRITDSTGIVLVLMPGGATRIGSQRASPDEEYYDPASTPMEPLLEVRLDPFFLSKYEMTQGQWLRVMGTNPSNLLAIMGDTFASRLLATFVDESRPLAHPVDYVDLQACVEALGRMGMEVPTDAQWEYGARGGTTTVWWFGGEKEGLSEVANIAERATQKPGADMGGVVYENWNDGFTFTAPVGQFAPNPFGLHDVYGNVWEWCREHFFFPYALRDGDGERSPAPGATLTRNGIGRGGGYSSRASETRSAVGMDISREYVGARIGLRPARRLDVKR